MLQPHLSLHHMPACAHAAPPSARGLPCLPSRQGCMLRPRARQTAVRAEFNEGAAQVKRLINRDRKEFLGNSDDILDRYSTEFGDDVRQGRATTQGAPASSPINPPEAAAQQAAAAAAASSSGAAAPPAAPTPSPRAANPFKSSASDNPFGPAPTASPFGGGGQNRSKIEPAGLRPDMGPDTMAKETPLSLLENITFTQVVIVLSFTLIIGLMVGTFYVVLQAGGIRLNGV